MSRSPKYPFLTAKLCYLICVSSLEHLNVAVFLVQAIYAMIGEFCENCQGQGQGQIKIQWYHWIP